MRFLYALAFIVMSYYVYLSVQEVAHLRDLLSWKMTLCQVSSNNQLTTGLFSNKRYLQLVTEVPGLEASSSLVETWILRYVKLGYVMPCWVKDNSVYVYQAAIWSQLGYNLFIILTLTSMLTALIVFATNQRN